jgi:hypothetical protein
MTRGDQSHVSAALLQSIVISVEPFTDRPKPLIDSIIGQVIQRSIDLPHWIAPGAPRWERIPLFGNPLAGSAQCHTSDRFVANPMAKEFMRNQSPSRETLNNQGHV